MCQDCAVKGLWHTDETQQLDNFISGFTKKKKRPFFTNSAAFVIPATEATIVDINISNPPQPPTQQQPIGQAGKASLGTPDHSEQDLEPQFIEPAGLGGDNPLA